jgi:hypothetical protein
VQYLTQRWENNFRCEPLKEFWFQPLPILQTKPLRTKLTFSRSVTQPNLALQLIPCHVFDSSIMTKTTSVITSRHGEKDLQSSEYRILLSTLFALHSTEASC